MNKHKVINASHIVRFYLLLETGACYVDHAGLLLMTFPLSLLSPGLQVSTARAHHHAFSNCRFHMLLLVQSDLEKSHQGILSAISYIVIF